MTRAESARSGWVWVESLQGYFPPTPYPKDGKYYDWDDSTESWVEIAPVDEPPNPYGM